MRQDTHGVNGASGMYKMNENKLDITGDITNYCNSRCAMCYLTYKKNLPPKQAMTNKQFTIIASKLKPYCGTLSLSCGFEPLINPEAAAIIETASSLGKQFKIRINTNGIAFNDKITKTLIDSMIQRVVISLDSATPELNKVIRGNTRHKDVVSNLKTLTQIKKKKSSENPQLVVRMVIHLLNLHELVPLTAMCADMGIDELYVQLLAPVSGASIQGKDVSELLLDTTAYETRKVFDAATAMAAKQPAFKLTLPKITTRKLDGATIREKKQSSFAIARGFHYTSSGMCRASVYNLDQHGNTIKTGCGNIFSDSVEQIVNTSSSLKCPEHKANII